MDDGDSGEVSNVVVKHIEICCLTSTINYLPWSLESSLPTIPCESHKSSAANGAGKTEPNPESTSRAELVTAFVTKPWAVKFYGGVALSLGPVQITVVDGCQVEVALELGQRALPVLRVAGGRRGMSATALII